MTLQHVLQQLASQLSAAYEKTEAMNIARLVIEKLVNLERDKWFLNKNIIISIEQEHLLQQYTTELLQHRPVQYVLEEAWFAGMKFYVNEHVLIPRPETEELVEWIVKDLQKLQTGRNPNPRPPLRILDIGTGSGCIPVALKQKLLMAEIFACDVSEAALQVAAQNAETNKAAIKFIQYDILNRKEWHNIPQADVIVSNPPYIPFSDRAAMQKNVLDYEPGLALFVPDEDPLLFYRTIAELAIAKKVTTVYFEIHEGQGKGIVELLQGSGFNQVELKKDMQGKDRMIKAIPPPVPGNVV